MAKKGEIILTVQSQDGSGGTVLDLYENISIPTTYQFSNVQDFSKTNSNHSQSFRIPGTPKNNNFFGSQYNANISGTFNPKKKASAVLSFDTLPQLVGYIQLKNVVIQKGRFVEYEVVLFGDVANFGAEVGDKKLKDYTTFLATLDHDFTAANVRLSWTDALLNGDVVYPLIDWGANYYGGDGIDGAGQNLTEPVEASRVNQWKPCVKLKAILDGIFEEEGFTYTSDFFTNNVDFNKLIIPCGGVKSATFDQGGALANEFTTQMVTPQPAATVTTLIGASGVRTPLNIFGVALADGGFDNGSDFGTATDSSGFSFNYYQVPQNGVYTLSFDLWLDPHVAVDATVSIQSCPNTNFITSETTQVTGDILLAELFGFGFIDNYSIESFLSSGDYVRITIKQNTGSSATYNFYTDVLDDNGIQSSTCHFNVRPTNDFTTGRNIDFTQCMPDLKAIDLFNSITKMFNLIIIPDPDNETNLLIEPYEDWIAQGDIVDWTDKLDISKDIQLTPTTELQSGTLLFTYKDGEDLLNKLTKESSDRTYGRKLIDQTNNDFAKGEEKVEIDFVATPSQIITDTSILIPKLIDKEGGPIDPKPRILVWHGLIPSGATWYFDEMTPTGTPVVTTEIYYAKASHYFQASYITLNGDDLNFGMETPWHFIISAPQGTLYKKYWENFIDEIYNETAKIMKASFRLNSADIFKFKFNDKIWIKDSYWRINKINGWTINDNKTVQVELLKLPDVKIGCEWLPYESSIGGTITMINEAGTVGVGTEECCVDAGFNWAYSFWAGIYQCRYLQSPGGGSGGNAVSNTVDFTYASPISANRPPRLIASGAPKSVNPLGENMLLAGRSRGEVLGNANIILGPDHEVSSGSSYGLITGRGNLISEVDSLALNNPTATDISFASVRGINGEALRKAEWAIGGGKLSSRSLADERTGRNNHGVQMYMAEGDTRYLQGEFGIKLWGIELLYQGDAETQIIFDEDTARIIRNDVVISFESGSFMAMNPEAFQDTNMVWRDKTTLYNVKTAVNTNDWDTGSVWKIYYYVNTSGVQMFLVEVGAKGGSFVTASCAQTYTQIKPFKGTI